ncbi:MAG: Thiamine-phosphate synthase [Methanoregula sp. PtaU1.Bin051]|nr:MAG: Thiamine-phosphate synthase [Methanoregula sp. PtaU1.Bin051]
MDCELYVITDRVVGRGRSHEEIARLAIEGGAGIVQLRDKECGTNDLVRIGRRIARIAKKSGTLFIVNDRPDIAIACGADGVHLGQDDMPVSVVKKIVPKGFIIGVSVSTAAEAKKAAAGGADYLAASPVFPTGSKPDARGFCGLSGIRRIRAVTDLPLVAIGGITSTNAREAIMAGADGVAVISAVVAQPDIARAARELKSVVRSANVQRAVQAGAGDRD